VATNKDIKQQAEARRKAYEAKVAEVEIKSTRRKNDNRFALILTVLALLLVVGSGIGRNTYLAAQPTASPTGSPVATPSASASPTATNSAAVPSPTIAQSRDWTGFITINGAKLNVTLDGKLAPQAVSNFLTLERAGFFNNITCHRLTTTGIYVLQCGDPKGNGSGGPGYSFGPIENAPADQVYKTGVLAMARVGGNAYSMGSQFFIVYKDSTIPSDAAGGYTVFGKITSGLDTVTKIAAAGVQGGGGDGAPATKSVLGAMSFK
jgi:peptidyl-prolyl cis-trans isomerase B (cyclophilin B)